MLPNIYRSKRSSPMELLSKKYMGALRRLLNIFSYKFLEATTVSV